MILNELIIRGRNLGISMSASHQAQKVRSNMSRRKVCVLAYEGLHAFEYGLAVDVFFSDNLQLGEWYDFQVVGVDPKPINGTGNIVINKSADISALSDADLIIVPGWRGVDDNIPTELRTALIDAHARGVKIATICTGIFVLAQCGLLDGKRATTHWQFIEDLRAKYPKIHVDDKVAFIEDDNLITSGGALLAIDMCLHIVRGDFGAKIANIIARRLNVNVPSDAGNHERQMGRLRSHHPRLYQGSIAQLLDKIRATINEDWEIDRMAGETHASARTLQRRFKSATGYSPHMWLTIERIELAKDLLETTNMNIQKIADVTGLKTPETFRHHFKRITGTSPTKYRAQKIDSIS